MMKIFDKTLLLLSAVAMLAACSEWTEPESLGLDTPTLEGQDPAGYARYLENLRTWKLTKHPAVMGTFDNSVTEPATRAFHFASLPDSLDFVLPDVHELTAWQAEEMHRMQAEKGTRFLLTIDYARLEQAWDDLQAEQPQRDDAADGFAAFMADRTAAAFATCDRLGYDGIAVWYTGKGTLHMTEQELAAYTARQEAFMAPVRAWLAAHEAKTFLFGGDPTTLLDKSPLLRAEYILIETADVQSVEGLTFRVASAMGSGIPSGRFVVTVSTVVADDPQAGGYYGREMALPLAARWVAQPSGEFTRAGLLIRDIQRDFYNASLIYKYTREAIDTINPSPKN